MIQDDLLNFSRVGKSVYDQGKIEPAVSIYYYIAGIYETLRQARTSLDFFYITHLNLYGLVSFIYHRMVSYSQRRSWRFQNKPYKQTYKSDSVEEYKSAENDEPQRSCGGHSVFVLRYYLFFRLRSGRSQAAERA